MNNPIGEQWLQLRDTNYQISSKGRLRYKNKFGEYVLSKAKQHKSNGYTRIHLANKGDEINIFLHKEVLEAFHPKPCNCFAKHIDGNRDNNILSNLKWSSRNSNAYIANKIKTIDYLSIDGSIKKKRSKISIGDVQLIHYLYNKGTKQKELSKLYNISQPYVSILLKSGIRILNGKAILYRKSSHELYVQPKKDN